MNSMLLLLIWLAPLLALLPAAKAHGHWWPVVAALPAIAAVILLPQGSVLELPWLLLGVVFGLDAPARLFLAFGAVLWLAAAAHAALFMQDDRHAGRFRVFFLLAMSGNLGLIVAQDLMSFYLGFALMGIAAYGLVVHDGNERVRRAGRVYLVMTLIGEMALFVAFVLLYLRVGNFAPTPAMLVGAGDLEVAMLVLAFAIKAGLIGVHVWLPLAHPAAPVAASAVLSGAMIKTALIGWMRYLPLGEQALPGWGLALLLLGVATALLAVPVGLMQRDPKVVLAYSSIAKMGLLIAGLGVALADPRVAPAMLAALGIYAAHHGLAKGALFLGVGVVKASAAIWPVLVLGLLALVMVGAPLTSGALAKREFAAALDATSLASATLLYTLLPLTALGSVLLMARFLYLARQAAGRLPGGSPGAVLPWLGLVAVSVALPLLLGEALPAADGIGVLLFGAAVAALVWRWVPPAIGGLIGRVPPGDLLVALEAARRRLSVRWGQGPTRPGGLSHLQVMR